MSWRIWRAGAAVLCWLEGKSCFLVDYGVKKTVGEGILGELPLEDFP
ncbi:hypothetical protein [Acetomicrobium sp.]